MTSKSNADSPKTPAHGSTKKDGPTKSRAANEILDAPLSIEQEMTSLRNLVTTEIRDEETAQEIRGILQRTLPQPDMRKRIDTITITLQCYHQAAVDPETATKLVKVYMHELKPYPDWAVEKSCLWWIGGENPRCSFKPVPGNLSAKAHELTDPIRAASIRLRQWEHGQ